MVSKHAGNLIAKLLEENRPEFKQLLQKLARKSEEILGDELRKVLPKGKHAAFAELLRK